MTALFPDLVDSHCHLDFGVAKGDARASPSLAGEGFEDLPEVLSRARAAGVRAMITIGSGRDVQSADAAVALAASQPDVFATVAVHPHDAVRADDAAFERLRALAQGPRVVAIGETGLDHHYDHSPRDVQRRVFARFIALAREIRKPVVVHTRAAPGDTLAVLRAEGADAVGGVIHCMSEDAAFAREALDLGFDLSFSGIVTFRNAESLRDVARLVPEDRILVETDAPFLAPVPFRGKRNEPAYVVHTVRAIAELRGVSPETLAASTAANARRRFRLPPA